MAQQWRTTVDVQVGEYKGNSFYNVQANFLRNQENREKTTIGHWNDPDMLLIGRAPDMTMEQMKTHYALWAFARAPLIISVDIAKLGDMSDPTSFASMLNNTGLIAINQDQKQQQCEEIDNDDSTGTGDHLGFYKTLVLEQGTNEYYFGLLIVNWEDEDLQANAKLNFKDAEIALTDYDTCSITDLWTGETQNAGGGTNEFPTTGLAKHSHLAYKIKCSAF